MIGLSTVRSSGEAVAEQLTNVRPCGRLAPGCQEATTNPRLVFLSLNPGFFVELSLQIALE